MIVPAHGHRFGSTDVFDNAKAGDEFETNSGLGGSWTIQYVGKTDDGKFRFRRPAREDWPESFFTYPPEEVLDKVYILVAESSTFREWNTILVTIDQNTFAVDKQSGMVWTESPDGYFKLFKKTWRDATPVESALALRHTRLTRKRGGKR